MEDTAGTKDRLSARMNMSLKRLRSLICWGLVALISAGCGGGSGEPASQSKKAVLLVRHEGGLGVLRDGDFQSLKSVADKEFWRLAVSEDGRRIAAIDAENRVQIFTPGETNF